MEKKAVVLWAGVACELGAHPMHRPARTFVRPVPLSQMIAIMFRMLSPVESP